MHYLVKAQYVARAWEAALPYTGWAGFVVTHNPLSRFRELARTRFAIAAA
jgi:hypothetical protein